MSSADVGTSSDSSRKYLTSRSRRTSAGSKFTDSSSMRPAADAMRCISGSFSFAWLERSTSAPHSSIFWCS